ncbi:hypothetical protein [Clostridium chromiireducens]|uniref:Uncharacterized protein n=1 Tax=Clostridium chromiireducens TaxID=225345 RepID=A0A1V4ILZ9_9CLOT|nr:hypothetical protein [Clostridium chromiireducens]OPJ60795.1 hypothetical protein CLCHR_27650 [Clostridium chromiireducens]
MTLNNSGVHKNSLSKKRTSSNTVKSDVGAEIGFPNNKDKGHGKTEGIVGKG